MTRGPLPRNSAAQVIEIFKASIPLLLEQDIHEIWNALVYAQVRI